MTMQYIRESYGVPCYRGVLIRLWMWDGVLLNWREAASPKPITSATYYVFAHGIYHPTCHLEYIGPDGFRLWPITDEQFATASLPVSLRAKMAPTWEPDGSDSPWEVAE